MINQKTLKEIINYDPVTGIVRWKKRVARCVKIGDKTGAYDSYGYLVIAIKNRTYKLHRIIWMYVYGELPNHEIDHINHIKHDNRIENLRKVKREENSKNLPMSKRNKSGVVGVCWRESNKLWRVSISIDGKQKEIMNHKSFFEAVCVRKSAEIKYGYHKNHGQ